MSEPIDVFSFKWARECPVCGVKMKRFADFGVSCGDMGWGHFEAIVVDEVDFRVCIWSTSLGIWDKEIAVEELDRFLKLQAFQ